MINIRVTQKKIAIDKQQLLADATKALALLRYPAYDLTIWITTDATIRRYNQQYRSKDKATDILSFPFYPQLEAGKRIRPYSKEEQILGDIIISAAYVERDAVRYGMSFDQRLRVLLVHGLCHLLGYDHMTDEDYRRMRAKEAWLLKKLAE
jgi:rRNA maturation RNase YbeY